MKSASIRAALLASALAVMLSLPQHHHQHHLMHKIILLPGLEPNPPRLVGSIGCSFEQPFHLSVFPVRVAINGGVTLPFFALSLCFFMVMLISSVFLIVVLSFLFRFFLQVRTKGENPALCSRRRRPPTVKRGHNCFTFSLLRDAATNSKDPLASFACECFSELVKVLLFQSC